MNAATPRCYLSLRCDLACWYCSNGHDIRWDKADELTGAQWLKRIAELPGDEIVFTGGEPTLHAGFLEIVTHCPKRMWVYSNFAKPLWKFPVGLDIHWRASCHAQSEEELGQWLENVAAMHARKYPMTLTTVYCPPPLLPLLQARGVTVDEPQPRPVPIAGRTVCVFPRRLIAPDGRRWHCASKMVVKDETGVVGHDGPDDTLLCEDATACVACDGLSVKRVKSNGHG